jgi:molybdopterin converting factor small subunit
MVTITLLGQLQTDDGERELACEITEPVTVRQLIMRQRRLRQHVAQLLKEKRLLITLNKRIASEDTLVHDGDSLKLVVHDGMGASGLAPS